MITLSTLLFLCVQYLLQCDHIVYTIVPVSGCEDLERAFVENSEGVMACSYGRQFLSDNAQTCNRC